MRNNNKLFGKDVEWHREIKYGVKFLEKDN